MGVLQRKDGSNPVALRTRTRVGRYPENDLVLDANHVSSYHALVEWGGDGHWVIKDLGSTNGTVVDGSLLGPGEQRSLSLGATLAFGDPQDVWVLAEDRRPQAEAVDVRSGERITAEHQLLLLGDERAQAVVVEERPGVWVLEVDGESEPVRDGQEVEVVGRRWRLLLPVCLPSTTPMQRPGEPRPDLPLGGASLRFVVSKDLEHVELAVEAEGGTWGSERTYARVLAELAKQRLEDAARGDLHPDEHGWVYSDELCRLADLDGEVRLNVEIHRARRDMAKHEIPNPAAIIQRRRGTRQLRIGTDRIEVRDHSRS